MVEGTSVGQHLNELNTITDQLSNVKIQFDDKIWALIMLASLLNSYEIMRIDVSNFANQAKLKCDDDISLIFLKGMANFWQG